MLNKILKFLYLLLFFLTPLMMYPYTSELFEFNKILFIYIISAFVLFVWLLKMIIYKKIIFEKTIFFLPIVLFLVSQISATIFSIDLHTSLFGYYGRFNGGLLSIIAYIVLYFAFVSNFDSKFVPTVLKTTLASSFLVILWGLPGKLGHDLSCLLFTGQFNNDCWTDQFRPAERMFSTLGQPNWLGAYLAIHFFIGLYFFFKTNHQSNPTSSRRNVGTTLRASNAPIYSILYTIYLILNYTTILFTRSRSSLLAAVVGFFLFAFFIILNKKKHAEFIQKLNLKSILYVIIGLFLLTLFFKTGIGTVDRYLSSSFYFKSVKQSTVQIKNTVETAKPITTNKITPSSQIRKIVWGASVDLFKKYPLFGTGVETFAYSYYFVRPASHNLTSEWDYLYNKAHNEYLNYLATTGSFGLGSYFLLIVIVCLVFLKEIFNNEAMEQLSNETISNKQLLLVCLFLSYISILITNFFGFSITVINFLFFLLPAIVITSLHRTNDNSLQIKSNLTELNLFQKGLIVGNFLILLYFVFFVFTYFFSDINFAKAGNLLKLSEYQQAYQLLKDDLSIHYEHIYEDKISNVLATLSLVTASQKELKIAQEQMTLSEYYNLKSIQASPYNVLYWKTRAKNHYLFYQITTNKDNLKTAIEALNKAFLLSPTDPKIPYTKALIYSLIVDDEKDEKKQDEYKKMSLNEIDNSINLKPDYIDGYILKGQLLKKYGQKAEAKKALQFVLDNLEPNNEEAKKELETL